MQAAIVKIKGAKPIDESRGGAIKYRRALAGPHLHHTLTGAGVLAFCMRQPKHHQLQNLDVLTHLQLSCGS